MRELFDNKFGIKLDLIKTYSDSFSEHSENMAEENRGDMNAGDSPKEAEIPSAQACKHNSRWDQTTSAPNLTR